MASSSSARPSEPRPWKLYGEVRACTRRRAASRRRCRPRTALPRASGRGSRPCTGRRSSRSCLRRCAARPSPRPRFARPCGTARRGQLVRLQDRDEADATSAPSSPRDWTRSRSPIAPITVRARRARREREQPGLTPLPDDRFNLLGGRPFFHHDHHLNLPSFSFVRRSPVCGSRARRAASSRRPSGFGVRRDLLVPWAAQAAAGRTPM